MIYITLGEKIMARKKMNIPKGESKQEKFRRVSNPRVIQVQKALDRLAKMPPQPSYDITEEDGKHVINAIKEHYDSCVAKFERAISGDVKAKEIKEYAGIDWDKELENTEEG